MVAQNSGHHFKTGRNIYVVDEREKVNRERANQRILAVKRQRAELRAKIRDGPQHLTDIRIVILGAAWAARSSAGNILLGKEAFKVDDSRTIVCCEVKHAEAYGRQLTVVDTPGWYCNVLVESTSELDKLEIRRSVCLCPPGPHVILLTIPIAITYDKTYNKAVEEHMDLLGKKVWNHTIVLFTRGDWLGDTTIEERIENEGKQLQWLIKNCGNRYHVFNCKEKTDNTQVIELLAKIEEIMMENNGCHYEPETDSSPSTELELKMKTAKRNMMKVRRQRDILQELLKERKYTLSDVRIVLLGGERVGKSTSGNIILQEHFFEKMPEEEWKKHEDELIERMLEAATVDLNEETEHLYHKRRGSINFSIPKMSGDSLLDGASSVGADTLDPIDKVCGWLRPRHAASSGHGTMSTTSSFQDPNRESLKDDIPVHKHNPSDMDNMKYFTNITEQKHTRSFSF